MAKIFKTYWQIIHSHIYRLVCLKVSFAVSMILVSTDSNKFYLLVPNYWMGVGPYGPLGHGSFIPIIEHVTKYILTVAKKMQLENIRSLQPKLEICESFAEHA